MTKKDDATSDDDPRAGMNAAPPPAMTSLEDILAIKDREIAELKGKLAQYEPPVAAQLPAYPKWVTHHKTGEQRVVDDAAAHEKLGKDWI